MASSLIGGLVNSGAGADSIWVVDPDDSACKQAGERFGVHTGTSLEAVLSTMPDTPVGVVLAIKPHIVESVCRVIEQCVSAQSLTAPLVVSVAAGVRASSMEQWLPEGSALIRCMPNTPALLGLGATALFANERCNVAHKESVDQLLKTAGMTLWVEEEAALDAVTALSGSGPAYFFYLMEHMAAAGTHLGLDEKSARELAIATAFGAASMARSREQVPAVLRENVTSKGGTTAAALQVFDDRDTSSVILEAMQAAHDRAVELGDQLAPQ